MKFIKFSVAALLGTIVIVGAVWFVETNPQIITRIAVSLKETRKNLAAVFSQRSISIMQINQKYQRALSTQNRVNLLIVPGHEPNLGGAEFGKLKERDMSVDLGDYLAGFLKNNNHYGITVTRDKQNWNPIFSDYFKTNWDAIIAFVTDRRLQMSSLMNVGLVKQVSGAYHAVASQDVALRLYGINKWANENNTDIEIHIHFNDFPRRHQNIPGEYSGVTIYVPESQYSNSTTTRAIAAAVLSRLSRYNAVSDMPKESVGVVEDQDLIAVGSNNNADAPSMLIEYGYIYEPQFQDPEIRDMALRDMAFQTYLGLQDFFGQKSPASVVYDTLMLPHEWQKNISKTNSGLATTDVFALQSALVVDGDYPAGDISKNDCPRSGFFGDCTAKALNVFQDKYNIRGESGFVGTKTREVLNSMFGS
jgi:N-acetylmuramoyl-L-alanine amidase